MKANALTSPSALFRDSPSDPVAMARPTHSDAPALVDVEVFARKRVPSDAMSFLGPFGPGACSAHDVLSLGDSFEVRRVYARRVPAQVVYDQTLRDWADRELVGQPMSCYSAPLPSSSPISQLIAKTRPFPAGRPLRHVPPENLRIFCFGAAARAPSACSPSTCVEVAGTSKGDAPACAVALPHGAPGPSVDAAKPDNGQPSERPALEVRDLAAQGVLP